MSRAHPVELRNRVLSLLDSGIGPKAVAEQTGLPVDTVTHWRTQRRQGEIRILARKGSGIVAPAPYARGLAGWR